MSELETETKGVLPPPGGNPPVASAAGEAPRGGHGQAPTFKALTPRTREWWLSPGFITIVVLGVILSIIAWNALG